MSRKRRLSQEDLDLWRRVADSTEALPKRPAFELPGTGSPEKAKPETSVKPMEAFDSDRRTPAKEPRLSMRLAPTLSDSLRKAPVQMDKKTFGRMVRGKLKPEARLDLHGMTLERAHGALARFVMGAHGSGKRLVLVITGKGKNRDEGGPIPVRFGVLRHQVPQWLATPPLSSVVMQVTPAHISHGGGGAYYVYLRRARS